MCLLKSNSVSFKKTYIDDIIKIEKVTFIDKIALGLKIRQLREQRRLTQMQLAELIDMSERTVSRIEVGSVEPELNTLISISNALGVSLDYLISDDTTISKDIYIHEITERVSKLNLKDIKHILGYVEFYIETKNEEE